MSFCKNFFLVTFLLVAFRIHGQTSKPTFDTAYVEQHPEKINLRLYLSRKFTNFVVRVPEENWRYVFEPNSGLNLGVGFTYENFTLNLAFPVGFLNPNRYQDWPRFLDLQSHIYSRKMIIDLFGQFYGGYSIQQKYLKNSAEDYLREDMRLNSVGINFNYLFRGRAYLLSSFIQPISDSKEVRSFAFYWL